MKYTLTFVKNIPSFKTKWKLISRIPKHRPYLSFFENAIIKFDPKWSFYNSWCHFSAILDPSFQNKTKLNPFLKHSVRLKKPHSGPLQNQSGPAAWLSHLPQPQIWSNLRHGSRISLTSPWRIRMVLTAWAHFLCRLRTVFIVGALRLFLSASLPVHRQRCSGRLMCATASSMVTAAQPPAALFLHLPACLPLT